MRLKAPIEDGITAACRDVERAPGQQGDPKCQAQTGLDVTQNSATGRVRRWKPFLRIACGGD
ncbi:MAG TPA: hypothetical protein VE422_29075 [Terriglobia bacterium]|jgi:hypothetical protein|nr:hypothetical protein [Terriglobia bacterium]